MSTYNTSPEYDTLVESYGYDQANRMIAGMVANGAMLPSLAKALLECADEYENACEYKGEYLKQKHRDAYVAESYRELARKALEQSP